MPTLTTVLVVEDEPIIRMDITDHLTDLGYLVLEAGNSAEAITLLESNDQIRLVFTDVDMPGSMNGLLLAAAVAKRWPPVRIIVTSGHRAVEITDIPDGSVFFSKPYSYADIASSIAELLA